MNSFSENNCLAASDKSGRYLAPISFLASNIGSIQVPIISQLSLRLRYVSSLQFFNVLITDPKNNRDSNLSFGLHSPDNVLSMEQQNIQVNISDFVVLIHSFFLDATYK